jgi:iron complex transport system substrate-binding protein
MSLKFYSISIFTKNNLKKLQKILPYLRLFLLFFFTMIIVWACSKNIPKDVKSNFNSVSQFSKYQCRVIKHAVGETCVPLNPKRVIVLANIDNIIALGIEPIGATRTLDGKFGLDLGDRTQKIVEVGSNGQPNLEKILYLKPDLILGWYWDAGVYDKLSYIAPTVLAKSDLTWQELLTLYAEALGKKKEAQQLLENYNKRIKLFRQKMSDRLLKTQVSVVSFWADRVHIEMQQSFCGVILKEIGLPRPPAQNKDKNSESVSLEIIPKLEGDVLFVVSGGHDESKLTQYRNHPLWSQLEAVKQGRVYEVDNDVWSGSWGIIAANRVLDDLFKYLIE